MTERSRRPILTVTPLRDRWPLLPTNTNTVSVAAVREGFFSNACMSCRGAWECTGARVSCTALQWLGWMVVHVHERTLTPFVIPSSSLSFDGDSSGLAEHAGKPLISLWDGGSLPTSSTLGQRSDISSLPKSGILLLLLHLSLIWNCNPHTIPQWSMKKSGLKKNVFVIQYIFLLCKRAVNRW